jgi:C4-type Zn-finger protein
MTARLIKVWAACPYCGQEMMESDAMFRVKHFKSGAALLKLFCTRCQKQIGEKYLSVRELKIAQTEARSEKK